MSLPAERIVLEYIVAAILMSRRQCGQVMPAFWALHHCDCVFLCPLQQKVEQCC